MEVNAIYRVVILLVSKDGLTEKTKIFSDKDAAVKYFKSEAEKEDCVIKNDKDFCVQELLASKETNEYIINAFTTDGMNWNLVVE